MPRRWCRFALLGVIGVGGVGCVSSEKPPPPLGLTPGLQSKLGTKSDAAVPPPSFDPSATGGKGVTAANSFNRTKPAGSGMGVSLPPPQLASNTAPPVSAPTQPGMAVAPPSADVARSAMPAPRTIEPIQPAGATATLPPPSGALPPPSEPPMTKANYPQPAAPPPVNLSVPMTDPDPRPVPPPPPADAGIPAPLSPLKSATERPLPGVPAGPLPPAEPLKPLK